MPDERPKLNFSKMTVELALGGATFRREADVVLVDHGSPVSRVVTLDHDHGWAVERTTFADGHVEEQVALTGVITSQSWEV